MSSCEWVVASPPRQCGPHRRGDDAGVYTDWLKWPLGAVLGHLCTLLRLARRPVVTQGDARVYTDQSKWPLGSVGTAVGILDRNGTGRVTLPQNGPGAHACPGTEPCHHEFSDACARVEGANDARARRRATEERRRSGGSGRPADGQLAALAPVDVSRVLGDRSEMGTAAIRTDRTDLSARAVYEACKRRQAAGHPLETYGDTPGAATRATPATGTARGRRARSGPAGPRTAGGRCRRGGGSARSAGSSA